MKTKPDYHRLPNAIIIELASDYLYSLDDWPWAETSKEEVLHSFSVGSDFWLEASDVKGYYDSKVSLEWVRSRLELLLQDSLATFKITETLLAGDDNGGD